MKLKRNCLTFLIVTILIISFCYFRVKETHAIEYEFETGFEESDPFAEWTPDYFGYGYEIQTDIVHAGVNACRSDLTAGAMTYELASNYSKHYSLVYFYINGTVPDAFGGGIFIRVWDPEITLYIETNASRGAGKSPYIRFYDQMNDDFSVLDSEGLTLGAWHSVAVYIEGDSASANHKCWVDGRLMASVSDDTTGYNVTGVEVANYHWSGDYDGRVFVDDFASNDKIPQYYFNFNFKDLDSENVEVYVDWALWNSTHDLGYTEGEATLYAGTYTLKTSKYGHLINTTTLDTETYGNSTIDINLNMKRHQSCPNGFIASNDTISSITVHAETPELLNFTCDGTTPCHIGIGVSKNASNIEKLGQVNEEMYYVGDGFDDAWEKGDGAFYYTDTNGIMASYYVVTHANYRCLGVRFPSIQIPSIASITSAKIWGNICVYDDWDANVDIYGNKVADPENFYDNQNIINATERPRTSAGVSWADQNIGTGWVSTPELKTVLQELIDQDGWNKGQAIAFLFIGKIGVPFNQTIFRNYESGGNVGMKLEVEWSYPSLEWTYVSSPSHIHFNETWFGTYVLTFPSTTGPVVGPHTPMNQRVKVNVRLNGDWLKGCNVTVEGGPDNRIEWGLTDVFGSVKFNLKTGSYKIVASYEEHRKVKSVYVSTHMTIGIDLTDEDIIISDRLPEDVKDILAWLNLPELDLTTETMLVFIIPLIVLVGYAVKKASEGPKKKWKYSYLK